MDKNTRNTAGYWIRATRGEVVETLHFMQQYGGGFASALATAWMHADEDNDMKLRAAFYNYLAAYSPTTT